MCKALRANLFFGRMSCVSTKVLAAAKSRHSGVSVAECLYTKIGTYIIGRGRFWQQQRW